MTRSDGERKFGPRPSASGESRRSKASWRSGQGSPLPPDESLLGGYPTGCCVLIHDHGGDGDGDGDGERGQWYMVVYRIGGGSGSPHCARMTIAPSDQRWNAGLQREREIPARTVVRASCWPNRPGSSEDHRGGERDPLADQSVDGSLMLGHQGHLSS